MDPTDLEVLTQQVAVLMYVNREHNLIQIFESIFHSRDIELKNNFKLLFTRAGVASQSTCTSFRRRS